MPIRLVPWEFQELSVTMVEYNYKLYCTIAELAQAIHTIPYVIRQIRRRHHEYFEAAPEIGVSKCHAISSQELHAIRDELKLKYLRSESLLSEDDMITVALLSHSEAGRAFHRQFLTFVKANARRGTVPAEQHEAVLQRLATAMLEIDQVKDRLFTIEQTVGEASPFMDRTASALGRALAAQRQTKKLREQS